jgi:hypothetical protein
MDVTLIHVHLSEPLPWRLGSVSKEGPEVVILARRRIIFLRTSSGGSSTLAFCDHSHFRFFHFIYCDQQISLSLLSVSSRVFGRVVCLVLLVLIRKMRLLLLLLCCVLCLNSGSPPSTLPSSGPSRSPPPRTGPASQIPGPRRWCQTRRAPPSAQREQQCYYCRCCRYCRSSHGCRHRRRRRPPATWVRPTGTAAAPGRGGPRGAVRAVRARPARTGSAARTWSLLPVLLPVVVFLHQQRCCCCSSSGRWRLSVSLMRCSCCSRVDGSQRQQRRQQQRHHHHPHHRGSNSNGRRKRRRLPMWQRGRPTTRTRVRIFGRNSAQKAKLGFGRRWRCEEEQCRADGAASFRRAGGNNQQTTTAAKSAGWVVGRGTTFLNSVRAQRVVSFWFSLSLSRSPVLRRSKHRQSQEKGSFTYCVRWGTFQEYNRRTFAASTTI